MFGWLRRLTRSGAKHPDDDYLRRMSSANMADDIAYRARALHDLLVADPFDEDAAIDAWNALSDSIVPFVVADLHVMHRRIQELAL